MTSFWRRWDRFIRTNIYNKKSIDISEEDIEMLYGDKEDVPDDTFSKTIYTSYHLGHTYIKLVKEDETKDGSPLKYQLVLTNYLKAFIINRYHERYVNEYEKKMILTPIETARLKKTVFEPPFWKKFMNKIGKKLVSPNLFHDDSFKEVEFERKLKDLINNDKTLLNLISLETRIVNPKLLKLIVGKAEGQIARAKPKDESSASKKALLDLEIQIVLNHRKGERLFVIFELKANHRPFRDMSIFNRDGENYDIIESHQNEKKVYIAVSLNRPGYENTDKNYLFHYSIADNLGHKGRSTKITFTDESKEVKKENETETGKGKGKRGRKRKGN